MYSPSFLAIQGGARPSNPSRFGYHRFHKHEEGDQVIRNHDDQLTRLPGYGTVTEPPREDKESFGTMEPRVHFTNDTGLLRCRPLPMCPQDPRSQSRRPHAHPSYLMRRN